MRTRHSPQHSALTPDTLARNTERYRGKTAASKGGGREERRGAVYGGEGEVEESSELSLNLSVVMKK